MVSQYHYTIWPDHGVPSCPTSLLAFVKKASAANPTDAGPMVRFIAFPCIFLDFPLILSNSFFSTAYCMAPRVLIF